ncbi:phage portal protein [Thalassotalea sp. 1_MG-2023]|uniref:phage portal protein n=1 Tax=Thalassotalea sp. 1_MG-2023 TaxID=3062680 RepID=UPI0026E1E139|nr:phage portal protein [Thalassotalea sp. 1_MG-2023]MDO6426226.1 phage portal protein [Thalassotalea sp. 1_MG-2023]
MVDDIKKENKTNSGVDCFSFGDPEPCLDNRITEYMGIYADANGIYNPPISLIGLIKLLDVNAQHAPILYFKRNMILKWFEKNPILNRNNFSKFAFDYLWSGMGYFQVIRNAFRVPIKLRHLPALNMRYTSTRDVYAQLQNNGKILRFEPGEVIQIKEYDPRQGIYAIPQYYGGIQSALLNEDATLFRRKYYKNGAHMGFIFSMADPSLNGDDEAALKKAISDSKGVGNFRSLFINTKNPNIKDAEKTIKITPIGDISTKDEFERIKKITLNDMLSMHRASEALSGQASGDSPGFGDLDKITRSYYNNEVVPLQQEMMQVNEYLPAHLHISFKEPDYSDLNPVAIEE